MIARSSAVSGPSLLMIVFGILILPMSLPLARVARRLEHRWKAPTAAASAAVAQDYPSRPIKFMHGFPPGGNVDIIGRLLGNECGLPLGQHDHAGHELQRRRLPGQVAE